MTDQQTLEGLEGLADQPLGVSLSPVRPSKLQNTNTYRMNAREKGGGVGRPTPPTPSPTPTPLRAWLDDLRARQVTISIEDGWPTLHGPATDLDRRLAGRYRHALTAAASGSHPDWWAWITGTSQELPDLDTCPDRCVTCNQTLDAYSPDGVPFCDTHVNDGDL